MLTRLGGWFAVLLFLILLLVAIGSASAAPRPSIPSPHKSHWYARKSFWISEAVIGAAVAFDYSATASRRGAIEGNWLIGSNPSNQRLAGVGLLGFGVYSGFNSLEWSRTEKEPSRDWRIFAHVSVPAVALGIHSYGAAHNLSLSPVPSPSLSHLTPGNGTNPSQGAN